MLGDRSVGRRAARRLALAAGAALLASAGGAAAGERTPPGATPFSRVDVLLSGQITERCDVRGGGDINFGELTGNQSASARVALDCNVPFDLSFQSAKGGLAHNTLPGGEGPFAGTLGYTLDVNVPLIGPHASNLHGRYESRALMARKTLSSGESIAAGHAQIDILTGVPQGAGLLAGQYSETLTITVTSRL